MKFIPVPEKKKAVLQSAVAGVLLAWSAGSAAVDFSIVNNQLRIQSGAFDQTKTIGSNGIIGQFTNVPVEGGLGIPTFSFTIVTDNSSNGTFQYEVAVVIDDDNSSRRLEAKISNLQITVNNGTITGAIPAQNLTFGGRNSANTFSLTGTLANQSLNNVTLSGGTLTFDAEEVLDKLKASGAAWTSIVDEFNGAGHYTYAIFVRQVSTLNTRFGTKSGTTFTELPCANSSDLLARFDHVSPVGAPAFALQGQFSVTGASGSAGSAPTPYSGTCTVSAGGGGGTGSGGGTTPPPADNNTDDDVEEIEDIVDDILIPGEGEIDDSTITAVDNAATAAISLATQLVTNINSSSVTTTAAKSQAVKALATVSKVVQITGNATGASSDPAKAAATRAKGVETVKGVASVLKALDSKLNKTDSSGNKADTLTQVEKDAVKTATRTTVVSTLKLLTGNAPKTEKVAVAQSLGEILSATLNLGLTLDDEDTATMLDAADAAADEGDDTDDALDKSVPIKPRPVLPPASTIAQNLGVSTEQANAVLVELAKAINPSDVVVGGKSAAETLLDGLLAALGSIPGGSNYDPDNGNTTVTIGGNSNSEQLARVSSTERDIPARAVSANVVSSSFPDGIRVRGNGSVVLTSDRIATIMVPAPYDPVNFYADLTSLGTVTTGDDGSINIDKRAFPVNFNFSGTFDYTGTITGGDPVAKTRLNEPESGADESDLDYIYTVTFRDGTRQRMQPYIDAQAFVNSVRARNLTVYTNRNTGIVTVNGKQFRPSYFLDPHSTATMSFWNDKKDAFGIAYRPIDVNEDGIVDYQIITEDGVQVAYGIPQ